VTRNISNLLTRIHADSSIVERLAIDARAANGQQNSA